MTYSPSWKYNPCKCRPLHSTAVREWASCCRVVRLCRLIRYLPQCVNELQDPPRTPPKHQHQQFQARTWILSHFPESTGCQTIQILLHWQTVISQPFSIIMLAFLTLPLKMLGACILYILTRFQSFRLCIKNVKECCAGGSPSTSEQGPAFTGRFCLGPFLPSLNRKKQTFACI